mmetsp:Transcript_783/g.1648  ORF Transcript_783/g.1648 Transcript_783/m.1648 type:complete len:93 (-) Transcript_783:191-469(-)
MVIVKMKMFFCRKLQYNRTLNKKTQTRYARRRPAGVIFLPVYFFKVEVELESQSKNYSSTHDQSGANHTGVEALGKIWPWTCGSCNQNLDFL